MDLLQKVGCEAPGVQRSGNVVQSSSGVRRLSMRTSLHSKTVHCVVGILSPKAQCNAVLHFLPASGTKGLLTSDENPMAKEVLPGIRPTADAPMKPQKEMQVSPAA